MKNIQTKSNEDNGSPTFITLTTERNDITLSGWVLSDESGEDQEQKVNE